METQYGYRDGAVLHLWWVQRPRQIGSLVDTKTAQGRIVGPVFDAVPEHQVQRVRITVEPVGEDEVEVAPVASKPTAEVDTVAARKVDQLAGDIVDEVYGADTLTATPEPDTKPDISEPVRVGTLSLGPDGLRLEGGEELPDPNAPLPPLGVDDDDYVYPPGYIATDEEGE